MRMPRLAANASVNPVASALDEAGRDLCGEHPGWIDQGGPHIVLEDDANPGARVF